MFSKSLLSAIGLLAAASTALAAPAVSCPVASTVTVVASSSAALPSSTGRSAAATAANFGSCSTPQIKFAAGLDGRKETAFAPVDTKSFNHGSADAITVITSFICQQLQSSCKANSVAISECTTATNAASAAKAGTGAQADAFNAVFGIKTNFASVAVVSNTGKTISSGSTSTASSKSTSATSTSKNSNNDKEQSATTSSGTTAVSSTSTPAKSTSKNHNNNEHSATTSSGTTSIAASSTSTPAKSTSKNNNNAQSATTSSGTTSIAASSTSTPAKSTSKNNNNAQSATTSSGTTSTAASSTSTSSTSTSNNNNNDEQSATTLASAVIATGFAQNGQATQEAGQVPSLTTTNNYINFCLTVNKPITNGQQITTGSCNPAPMGVIAGTTNMPSSKFTNPKNFQTIKANTAFTVTMAINNLETGNFVNAASNYYSAPQQVNSAGNIIGHTHFVIEAISSLNSTQVSDPRKFAFFKGVNGAAVNGVVSADVTAGLPAGDYRLASINAAANHQPVLVAVAQHGSLDDVVYFTVTN